ncbi:MAG: maleylpyruvate isomerase family mycothiol-dependent enzyme [Marmoricola sp.]
MTLSTARCLDAIATHSRGFAEAARDNLDSSVEHCPEWSVADLVWHVTEVHWFWRTIAGERLDAPPDESRRPARAPDEELVDTFLAGAEALVETLGAADQSAPCWTWFPPQQDVAFVTRHQVQEAAVHHWDAAHAVGRDHVIDGNVAADSVEEFLTCSLADADDAEGSDVTLEGVLRLRATDTGQTWTVSQAGPDAALLWSAAPDHDAATISGKVSDLLLWLYGRVDLPADDAELVARFRSLSSR